MVRQLALSFSHKISLLTFRLEIYYTAQPKQIPNKLSFRALLYFRQDLKRLMDSIKRQVLILGGGFGGVKAALELANHPKYEVTLLSDSDHFRYYPALYRTATGASQLASDMPLGEIFAGK